MRHIPVSVFIRVCLLFLFAATLSVGSAQLPAAFSLFENDSIIDVTLKSDLKLLVKNKHREEYQPAELTITRPSGETVVKEVKIKSRGNRRKEVCYYPPIRVKFDKDDYAYNKLKWVIPCQSNEGAEQLLLKEYICYKIYRTYTDRSFRTALMRVKFVDTGRDNKEFTSYSFVIEDIDQIADQLGGREYDPVVLREKILDKDLLTLYTMFQYMIGNTDWHVSNSHNIKAVTDPAVGAVVLLPYDFDYSGVVNASYAVPHESLRIKSVTERHNKGSCLPEDLSLKYREILLEKRAEIDDLIRSFPYYKKKTGDLTAQYIEDFFDEIESEKRAKSIFSVNCQSWK